LASLLCTHVPVMLSPVRGCDSFCVSMESWFGLTANCSRANSQSISRYFDRSECWVNKKNNNNRRFFFHLLSQIYFLILLL